MLYTRFSEYVPDSDGSSPFDRLLKIFQELLLHTSGDVEEALSWLTELDKTYNLTDDQYGIADFIQELKDRGYLQEDGNDPSLTVPGVKMEIALRKKALDDIFGQLAKTKQGGHNTKYEGQGVERTSEIRPYEYGDRLDQLAISESLRNAQINNGLDEFMLTERDLEVRDTLYQSRTSTVLMIDISHSMILYGEDRITPAKKVAMGLAELITTRYPKDTLDIIVFGNDAWAVQLKDLPYLQVGPYHTNTVAGLQLAIEILNKRRNQNKQIMMITDGKPSCIKIGKKYYKNSFGLDKKIINRTLGLAVKCRKLNIPVTTFMIARDPYLMQFVDQFTQLNNGKAYYSSLDGLGEFVFLDYKNNKRKRK